MKKNLIPQACMFQKSPICQGYDVEYYYCIFVIIVSRNDTFKLERTIEKHKMSQEKIFCDVFHSNFHHLSLASQAFNDNTIDGRLNETVITSNIVRIV